MTRRIWVDQAEQDNLLSLLTNLVIILEPEITGLQPEAQRYFNELKDFVRGYWENDPL